MVEKIKKTKKTTYVEPTPVVPEPIIVEPAPVKPAIVKYQVIGGNLNLREMPSTSAKIIRVLTEGSTLYGTELNGWIKTDDGFVMAQFVKKI